MPGTLTDARLGSAGGSDVADCPTASCMRMIQLARPSRPTCSRLRRRSRRHLGPWQALSLDEIRKDQNLLQMPRQSPRESLPLFEARRLHTPALKTAAAEARSSDFRASAHVLLQDQRGMTCRFFSRRQPTVPFLVQPSFPCPFSGRSLRCSCSFVP